MKLLVADDDPVYQQLYLRLLGEEFEITVVGNGGEAWELLRQDPAFRLAILNWQMPVMNGVEVCRLVRATLDLDGIYLLVATANRDIDQVIEGFIAGADDYVIKPFYVQELAARLRVGRRVTELQSALEKKICELEQASRQVKLLQGLLPICSYCKRIRTEEQTWQEVEAYVSRHSEAQFSHGVCPECCEKFLAVHR